MAKNEIDQAWDKAIENPGQRIDIGRFVVCDLCNKDHTDLPDQGGFIFCSKGVCPACAPSFLAEVQKCREEDAIKATCPPGVSFADFVRGYRGGNNTIRVQKLTCINCKKPFTEQNVKTEAGWLEAAITLTCENCFDAMFQEHD